MERTLDVVGFGECLIEMNEIGGGLYKSGFAGDVLNTLFYASRLGLSTGLMSLIGTDHFTNDLVQLLKNEKIELDAASFVTDRSNGLYLISRDAAGNPSYDFWRNASAARELFVRKPVEELTRYAAQARYFQFSAIALAIVKERESIFRILDGLSDRTTILFDTNVRVALWENLDELRRLLITLANCVDILFVTDSDDRVIYGERKPEDAINSYLNMGFGTVVYRRGAKGCIVASQNEMIYEQAVRDVDVVDATGAGDGFNAGFIFGLSSGLNLAECGRMGNAVAAMTLGVHGGISQRFSKAMAEENFLELTRLSGVDPR